MDKPLLSRSGRTMPLGKLTESVKTKLDPLTMRLVEECAHDACMPISEWLREVLMRHVHDDDFLRNLQDRRERSVSRKGPEKG